MERRSSTPHYQTFPTEPPHTRGHPRGRSFWKTRDAHPPPTTTDTDRGSSSPDDGPCKQLDTPMPTKQLIILAIISLAEQTALNSISPYLPEMAASFPEVDAHRVGLFVGVIASSFAAAQFASKSISCSGSRSVTDTVDKANVFWGTISDRVGVRTPVP